MLTHHVQVCIAGGGPAGMVLGLLLAKQGIKTLVLERHADFHREFRGEVFMPRFTETMRQIGLNDFLRTYDHLDLHHFEIHSPTRRLARLDLANVAPDVGYAMWMPQPTLLGALHDKGKTLPDFDLWFDSDLTDLIQENGRITGARVSRNGEPCEVRAPVVVGADGRTSSVLKKGGFEILYEDYSFDVLWFTIPRTEKNVDTVRTYLGGAHRFLILPKHPDLWQCGLILRRGELADLKRAGIAVLRDNIRQTHPMFAEFAAQLKDFSPFHPLAAKIHGVRDWARDGCLLIGDAAHCCSPVGAIGVSMAVSTAVAAGRVIAEAILAGDPSAARLSEVQKIRQAEVTTVHRFQRTLSPAGGQGPLNLRSLILPLFLFIGSRTGLLRHQLRKLITQNHPLPVTDKMTFS
ncbi:MAG: FAD-dependent monooxygenase [Verrucomicrobiae bacterium]|nr:FAD-dependent monooxygenase [Verrucomicrobiae bacterium]